LEVTKSPKLARSKNDIPNFEDFLQITIHLRRSNENIKYRKTILPILLSAARLQLREPSLM
jgi:hypothetical protein